MALRPLWLSAASEGSNAPKPLVLPPRTISGRPFVRFVITWMPAFICYFPRAVARAAVICDCDLCRFNYVLSAHESDLVAVLARNAVRHEEAGGHYVVNDGLAISALAVFSPYRRIPTATRAN